MSGTFTNPQWYRSIHVSMDISNACFLRALDGCYNRYADRYEAVFGDSFDLAKADFAVFHAPYNKLVQKSFGRYMYNDQLRGGAPVAGMEDFKDLSVEETYENKGFLKQLVTASKDKYSDMVQPSELITKQCGNSYCGSSHAGLLSLITNKHKELKDKRALVFSYGSGLAATLFSVKFGDTSHIAETANVIERLNARTKVSPEVFTKMLSDREESYTKFDYEPSQPISELQKGTYYLQKVDDKERRIYSRAFHTQAGAAVRIAPQTMIPLKPIPNSCSKFTPLLSQSMRFMRRFARF
eukprot:m.119091 g.119091  ORF g.119091 m.119091 type:complete len:297 (-) comp14304_c0_seq2:62-952(-)